ncbi:MAG: tripartite tricarboxylate transporter substrate binding protein [Planctomycetes bacterium]|nr:tripartite tricarboxylate transporter substrate binding protein [Planctomycetota bacterium]
MRTTTVWVRISVVVLWAVALAGDSQLAAEEWPTRPITNAVHSNAGGGTDLGNRLLASLMEQELPGSKINVVNMPGASGGVAANFVWQNPHDGYSWVGISEAHVALATLGAHNTTTKDWSFYLLGGTQGTLSVREDSPYQTAAEVLQAMRDNPGQIKLAASQAGTIWHIKAILLSRAAGVDFKFIPYQGSNPSILACLSGEVDVIITGMGEQAEYLAAKKLRPLAMIELETWDVPSYDGVPSICETVPEMKAHLPLDQFVGFVVPADTPAEVQATIADAFKKACASDQAKEYARTKFINITALTGDEAKKVAEGHERVFSWLLYDLNLAPNDPSTFGIPKP